MDGVIARGDASGLYRITGGPNKITVGDLVRRYPWSLWRHEEMRQRFQLIISRGSMSKRHECLVDGEWYGGFGQRAVFHRAY
jgi:hypothetical protein